VTEQKFNYRSKAVASKTLQYKHWHYDSSYSHN